jgi:hypothetical protein
VTDTPDPAPAEAPRRKLTLGEQAAALRRLLARAVMADGRDAREAWLRLDADDLADLRQIEATLNAMMFYRADQYVRDQAAKRARK